MLPPTANPAVPPVYSRWLQTSARSLNPGCGWIPDVEPVFDAVEEYCEYPGSRSFGPPLTSTAFDPPIARHRGTLDVILVLARIGIRGIHIETQVMDSGDGLDVGGQPGVHLQPRSPASSSDVSGGTRATNTDIGPDQTVKEK